VLHPRPHVSIGSLPQILVQILGGADGVAMGAGLVLEADAEGQGVPAAKVVRVRVMDRSVVRRCILGVIWIAVRRVGWLCVFVSAR
jgi:hypothetical protein